MELVTVELVVSASWELVEIELVVVEDSSDILVEVANAELVAPAVDDVEVELVDVISTIVVVEVGSLESERVLDEVDVPPFEVVKVMLVSSPVLEADNDVVDIVVEPVEDCEALLVVVVAEVLAEVDVVWEPPPVVVVTEALDEVDVVWEPAAVVVVAAAVVVLAEVDVVWDPPSIVVVGAEPVEVDVVSGPSAVVDVERESVEVDVDGRTSTVVDPSDKVVVLVAGPSGEVVPVPKLLLELRYKLEVLREDVAVPELVVAVAWVAPAVVVVPGEEVVVLVVGGRGEFVVVSKERLVLAVLVIGGVVLELGDELDEIGEDVTVPELVVAGITTEVVLDPLEVTEDAD